MPRPATLLKGDPMKVYSCEICEIYKNTFFYRAPPVAASGSGCRKSTKFTVYMIKVTGLQRKKKKNSWLGVEATTNLHKLNYKGNLGWLKSCCENFL